MSILSASGYSQRHTPTPAVEKSQSVDRSHSAWRAASRRSKRSLTNDVDIDISSSFASMPLASARFLHNHRRASATIITDLSIPSGLSSLAAARKTLSHSDILTWLGRGLASEGGNQAAKGPRRSSSI
eukprot:CAMPEP_0115335036 /NCGR_PEP_ID=MMETSP0270-20121206/88223_1 /TAXON_ID=71861 /ORGANISM="Scrippsiella trochoidea, Strain CCMP3099" /LENGTH=127 /DNA_ID=CAMNT_0002756045 /DNA_START=82 /DNA_END=465 /DNA_ORIENTATION=+